MSTAYQREVPPTLWSLNGPQILEQQFACRMRPRLIEHAVVGVRVSRVGAIEGKERPACVGVVPEVALDSLPPLTLAAVLRRPLTRAGGVAGPELPDPDWSRVALEDVAPIPVEHRIERLVGCMGVEVWHGVKLLWSPLVG